MFLQSGTMALKTAVVFTSVTRHPELSGWGSGSVSVPTAGPDERAPRRLRPLCAKRAARLSRDGCIYSNLALSTQENGMVVHRRLGPRQPRESFPQ